MKKKIKLLLISIFVIFITGCSNNNVITDIEYSKLEESFDRLYTIGENNSKINSDVEYNMLKEENNSINSKIEYSKEFYNNEVNAYNSKTSSFISNLVVKMFDLNRYNIFR